MRDLRLLGDLLVFLLLSLLFGSAVSAGFSFLDECGWAALGGRLSSNAWELLRLAAINFALFAQPLFVYGAIRGYALGALGRVRLRREQWSAVVFYSFCLLGGAYALYELSVCLIGLLPVSWGIGIEDAVAQDLESLMRVQHWSDLPVMAFSLALVPAVSEELFFRAYLQRRLIRLAPHTYWLCIVVVSVLFSFLHASLVGFLSRFLLSLGLGYAYYRRGNIAVPIFIHALNNLVTLACYVEF